MKVRILSFFLTLCMVLSVFPAVVFAEDVTDNVTDPKDFATILEESTDGTVKLEKSENVFVTINDDVTIDLNGYKLTGYISAPGKVVTITDSKLTGEFAAEVVGNGEKDAKLVIKSAGRIAPSLKANVATTSEITTYTDYLKVTDHSANTESKYVVNGVSYYYFADALAAVAAEGTIKVVASAVINDKIDKDVTIESDAAITLRDVELVNGATVTVTGGCTLTVTDVKGNGTVEFANVSMTAYPTVVAGAAVAFEAYAGYYEYVVPTTWYDTTILVQVGNLLTAIGENIVAYVINGKNIQKFQDMDEAIKSAMLGGTLVLNTDYDKLIEIPYSDTTVTIELNGKKLLGSIINNGILTIQEKYATDGIIPKIINKEGAILLTVKSGKVADIENYARCEFRGGILNNLHTEGEEAEFIVYYVGENVGFVSADVAAQLTRDDNFNANAGLVYNAGLDLYVVTAYDAFIGTTGYISAEEAFRAAQDGEEVVLYVDYNGLVVDKNLKVVLKNGAELTKVTINAGKTLTAPFGESEYTYGEGFYEIIKAPVAKIGSVYYISLQDAVNAAADGVKTTIVLVDTDGDKYVEGAGVVVPAGKNIVFDFDGNTYDVTSGFVGSAGTETNAFQLLKGSNVTFKNGTLVSTKSVTVGDKTVWAKILIQNYTDLIDKANPEEANTSLYIKDFTIDASKNGDLVTKYALSNNNGYVRIADSTIIADNDQVAFDVYYSASYAAGVSVLVTSENGNPTFIKGDIEVSGTANVAPQNVKLSIHAGKFEGDIVVDEAFKNSDVVTIKVRGEGVEGAYETSFNGISNYEEFYKYFVVETVGGVEKVYGPANIDTNEDGTYKFDVVLNPAYVAEVNGVKYIDIDQALKFALANAAEIKLLADFADGIVIPEGEKNITLNLGGKTVAGITSNAGVKVTVNNGMITDTVTVNSGSVELTSAKLTVVADTLFNIAAGANGAVRLGTVKVVAKTVKTGEGSLSVKNGHWYIPDGKELYNYIGVEDTINGDNTDADGEKYYTISTLQYPVAQVYVTVDGNKVVLDRFSYLDEAIATAVAEKAVVEILQANKIPADFKVDLGVGKTVTIEGIDNALATEKNTTTYTEVVGNVYTGYPTAVIITDDATGIDYYYDTLSILGEVDYVGKATIYTNVVAGTLTSVCEYIFAIDIAVPNYAGGFNIALSTVGNAYTPVAITHNGVTNEYAPGVYNTLDDYDAELKGVRYATLADAVKVAANGDVVYVNEKNVTDATEFAFVVETGKVVTIAYGEKAMYGEGKYANLKDYDATIDEVRYATVDNAANAAVDNDVIEIVATELDKVVINTKATKVVINANGCKIGTVTVKAGKALRINNLVAETLVNDGADLSSSDTGIFYSTIKNLVCNAGATSVRGNTSLVGTLTVNDGASVTLSHNATVENLVLVGTVTYKSVSDHTVKAVDLTEFVGFTAASEIRTGKYYVAQDVADAIYATGVLPEGYYFARYEDADGETYYSPLNGDDIVAEVDGFYYDNSEESLAKAVSYANISGKTINILVDTGVTLVLTEAAPSVTVNGKANVVPDSSAYYVDVDGNTYTRKTIVAIVGGTNYDNYGDAINAFLKGEGKYIEAVVLGDMTVTADEWITVAVKGSMYVLDAGTYNLAKLVVDAVVDTSDGLYNFVSFEDALAKYPNDASVTIIYMGKDVKTVELNNGKFHGGVVKGGTLILKGTGVVDLRASKGGKVEIASMDLKFFTNVLLDPNVSTNIEGKNPEELCMDKEKDGEFYILTNAELSYNGKGYHNFDDAYNAYLNSNAAEHTFKIYASAELTVVNAAFDKAATIELNGNALTVNSIVANADLTINDGNIAVDEASEAVAVITVSSNATLTLTDVEVAEANKYNTHYSCNSSVALLEGATLAGNNFTIYDLLVDATVTAPAYLNVEDVCNITDASSFSDGVAVYYRESKINHGELVCLNHKMIVDNGVYKCEHCGEEALQLIVGEANELTDVKVYVDGELLTPVTSNENVEIYYLFAGDTFTVEHTAIPAGMSFVKWNYDVTTLAADANDPNTYTIDGNRAKIWATLEYNPTVSVQINAPIFTVEGIGGVQLGSAIFQINQGAKIKVVYDSEDFLENSEVIYWINENGTIVGRGPELNYTVPAMGASITAIAHMTNDGSTLAIFQNGNDAIGVKVMGYGSYTADNINSFVVPKYPSLGTQTVIGWNTVLGAEKALTVAEIKDAILAADGVIKFYPVVEKAPDVQVTVNWGDKTSDTVMANPDLFTVIPAKKIEGYKLAYWTVSYKGTKVAEFYTDEIIYNFDVEGYTVDTVYVADTQDVERDAEAFIYDQVQAGKVILNGVLQLPGEAKLIDAGIVYSTKAFTEATLRDGTAQKVVVKHATALDKKYVVYTLTLNATKITEATTIYAASYLTYVDADGHVVTEYSVIDTITYDPASFIN